MHACTWMLFFLQTIYAAIKINVHIEVTDCPSFIKNPQGALDCLWTDANTADCFHCAASPSPCKVGPVFHHAAAQLLLFSCVVEPLLQRQTENKLNFIAVDHAHPFWPGQVGRPVVKQVKVKPSLTRKQRKKHVIKCHTPYSFHIQGPNMLT